MPETTKPSWVEALDEAKSVLRDAGNQDNPEVTDSKTRLAHTWLDIAILLKGC